MSRNAQAQRRTSLRSQTPSQIPQYRTPRITVSVKQSNRDLDESSGAFVYPPPLARTPNDHPFDHPLNQYIQPLLIDGEKEQGPGETYSPLAPAAPPKPHFSQRDGNGKVLFERPSLSSSDATPYQEFSADLLETEAKALDADHPYNTAPCQDETYSPPAPAVPPKPDSSQEDREGIALFERPSPCSTEATIIPYQEFSINLLETETKTLDVDHPSNTASCQDETHSPPVLAVPQKPDSSQEDGASKAFFEGGLSASPEATVPPAYKELSEFQTEAEVETLDVDHPINMAPCQGDAYLTSEPDHYSAHPSTISEALKLTVTMGARSGLFSDHDWYPSKLVASIKSGIASLSAVRPSYAASALAFCVLLWFACHAGQASRTPDLHPVSEMHNAETSQTLAPELTVSSSNAAKHPLWASLRAERNQRSRRARHQRTL